MIKLRTTLNDLDLTSLRLLVAAIEEGNISRAGEREHISISSVSRRIAELEARLGVPLLHRHDRGVTPTAAALEVLPRLRDMLGLLTHVLADLSDHAAGIRGMIRIRANLTALAGTLPHAIRSFLDSNPGIEVEIEDASTLEAMHAVRVGTADLGLVSGTVEADDLELILWAEDKIAVVLPTGHPLAARPAIRFADVLNYPFIGMQRDSALLALYRHQAALIGGNLQERARVTGFEIACRLVGAGLGLSMLPSTAAQTDARLVVRPLDEPWAKRPLMICIQSLERISAGTRMLVESLLRGAGHT